MRTLIFTLLIFASGCARYEYDITRPPELAQHIGSKADQTFTIDDLEYRLRTVDGRLVMRIYNATDEPVTLNGDRSFVVDAGGQSHPLTTQTMAPRSFIKLILPPQRPRLERSGPSIGIGVGTMIGGAHRRRYGAYAPTYYPSEPRYMTLYEDNALYWDWKGESSIRLTLVYQRGDQTTRQHEFVIARKKM